MQVDSLVRSENQKFPWRMMLISIEDVKVLLEFFRVHVVSIKRGAKVLLERIEDNEEGLAHSGTIDFTNIPSQSPSVLIPANHSDRTTTYE